MFWDFIQFYVKNLFYNAYCIRWIATLFAIDFTYILAVFGVFITFFAIRFAIIIVQTNKHYDELAKIAREKERVKYVIIK